MARYRRVRPFPGNANVRLIPPPGAAGTAEVPANPPAQFRGVTQDPARDGGMVQAEPALGHQFLEVPVAEGITQIPPNGQENDVALEMSPTEQLRSRFIHRSSPYQTALPAVCHRTSQRLPGSPRRRRLCRYLATVRSETSKPSFSSSPWIFGAPQSEFSVPTRRIRVRISSLTLGRPPLGRDRQRQYRRKPARCHPTTVFGFTMTRTSDHRGHMYLRLIQNKRSRRISKRRGRSRFSQATCFRRCAR